MRKDWMFKLVGKEYFTIGKSKAKCCVSIDAVSGFAYEYSLEVSTIILSRASEVGSPNKPPGLRAATRHGARDPLVRSHVDF